MQRVCARSPVWRAAEASGLVYNHGIILIPSSWCGDRGDRIGERGAQDHSYIQQYIYHYNIVHSLLGVCALRDAFVFTTDCFKILRSVIWKCTGKSNSHWN